MSQNVLGIYISKEWLSVFIATFLLNYELFSYKAKIQQNLLTDHIELVLNISEKLVLVHIPQALSNLGQLGV